MSDVLKQIAAKSGGKVKTGINPGEGAFYGPKFEYVLRDAIGRDWQCGTMQVDFNLPERFGAFYIDADGEKKTPVMIHRAMFGSMERFAGILLESTAGHLPLWLAPVQAKVCTIVSDADAYAEERAGRADSRRACAPRPICATRRSTTRCASTRSPRCRCCWWSASARPRSARCRCAGWAVQQQQVMPLDEAIAMLAEEAVPPDSEAHAADRLRPPSATSRICAIRAASGQP